MDGFIFNIQRYSIDDGPGIRTTVFVKGCAMRCPWCSNPESISAEPQLLHRFTTCTKCGDCAPACDKGAITFTPETGPVFDRELCDVCGKCAWECINQAIKISGESMSIEKVWKTIKKDMVYYEESGGGVTCSGGEILMQPEFVNELFKKCRENGVHTCADTAGFGSAEALDLVLEYADLVYFDIKWLDPVRHEELTGVPLEPVVRNFKTICERGIPIVVRIPLIPDFDDNSDNLAAIAKFVKENAPGADVHIMPYHRYGESKYESLGIEYPLKGLRENTPEDLERARKIFEAEGVSVEVK
ncbi:MAG: glycyl-radical enzyme activating protein [Oscillospiraceae bacterium]|nr:glycyl-radical enzyme activating protein [Oscillospiraceae bacterium]